MLRAVAGHFSVESKEINVMETCDALVIGAGISGGAAACALPASARVLLLEQESQPGYHTTGRPAPLFTKTYGNRAIRTLTSAGRAFFRAPPDDFDGRNFVFSV